LLKSLLALNHHVEIVCLTGNEAAGWVEFRGLMLKLWGEIAWTVFGESLG